CRWVKLKYELDWTPQSLPSNNPEDLKKFLLEEANRWDEERFERRSQRIVDESNGDIDGWLQENMQFGLTDSEKEQVIEDPVAVTTSKIKQVQRAELAQLERSVLLQIFDGVWKDHLYQMDQAKESIGFRSFSQLDPRIEYKREGARLFDEMFEHIQDRVSDLVFKARMQVSMPPAQQPPNQQQPAQAQQKSQARPALAKPKAAEQSIRAASEAAKSSGGGTMTVGRNEPCPCGSGKKYKKCCGAK
ncbi:MAG TPA: hypothetical protein EYO31_02220, partial [Phycisphaerales bacterium]|nr:hypothetical protein [Phycisphaerales bacterium]